MPINPAAVSPLQLNRKALVYLINLMIVDKALHHLQYTKDVDSTQIINLVYDEFTNAAKAGGAIRVGEVTVVEGDTAMTNSDAVE